MLLTQDQINAIFPKVAELTADALAIDLERVTPTASLIEDLGAESIDFLDLIFRLEREFNVKIPHGKITEDARGDLSVAEFEEKGILTPVGLERLKAFLTEVPADRFKSPMRVVDIPKLFTTETFCKVVLRQQQVDAP